MFASGRPHLGFGAAVGQILLLDLVFSIDSIVTRGRHDAASADHGRRGHCCVILMVMARNAAFQFHHAHPTIVMLALAFLLMIGMVLFRGLRCRGLERVTSTRPCVLRLVEGLNMLAAGVRQSGG